MDETVRPPRRPRGGREPVTPARVTDAALAIIDAEGLDALTMRRLATDLGVEPMTVYRQFSNKDAILASVAERLWASLPGPPDSTEMADPAGPRPGADPGADWRMTFGAMWSGLHGLMQAHPNAIPLIARGGGLSASAGSGTAGMIGALHAAGLDPDEAAELVHTLSACVVGFGFATLWAREAAQRVPADPVDRAAPPPDVPPDLLPYLDRLGRWDPGDFDRAVTRLVAGYGTR